MEAEEDQAHVHDALQASEERYRRLVELSPDAIVVYDDGKLVLANRSAVRLFGAATPDDIIGKSIRELIHPDFWEIMDDSDRETAEPPRHVPLVEGKVIRLDGRVVDVEMARIPFACGDGYGVQAVIRDISERKHLEDQFRQAQKMEAVGQLAGGIAHDFNNLLTAITGYSELLLSRLEEDAPLRREIEEIRRAGERAASLTRQFLAFSRRQMLQPRILDLNAIVGDMDRMLRRLCPALGGRRRPRYG